jgi:Flp pilus assembly protein TadG
MSNMRGLKMKLLSNISKMLRSTSGNTGIIFALAAVPMLLGAGAAVDMVRANRTQAVLQAAADSAALGAGVSGGNVSAVEQLARTYLEVNGANAALDIVDEIEVERDEETGSFNVKIKGKIKTSFMTLAGVPTMSLEASSQVMSTSRALEIVLVLDSTDSMNFEGRLDALKTSARDLVRQVLDSKTENTYVKIGIVPFANYVNVGLGSRGQGWLNVPADTVDVRRSCNQSYPNATSSNCRTEPYSYVKDGVNVSTTTQICDWDYGTPVEQCGDVDFGTKWNGCVGSRNYPLDTEIGTPNVAYPGVMGAYCPTPIKDLSDDKNALIGTINALNATGETYIPAGLLWGWNMLNPAAPLTSAKSQAEMASIDGKKVIVLMSDGASTLVPTYPDHVAGSANTANNLLDEICDNVKGDDIEIFTVAFKVSDNAAESALQSCASGSGYAFDADSSSELVAAFREIAGMLSEVHLTK